MIWRRINCCLRARRPPRPSGSTPTQHRPAVKIILGELAENRFEIDLPIAQRTKTPRPLLPVLIAAVDPAAPVAAEFGIFDVKRFDSRMIDIDIRQVVHLLKMKVAGVIEHIAARMVIDPLQETLEGHAVMQVFAGMDFVADIHALFVKTSSSGRQRRASSSKASSRSG